MTTWGPGDFAARYVIGLHANAVDELVVVGGTAALPAHAVADLAEHAQLADLSGTTGIQEAGLIYIQDGELRAIGPELPPGVRYVVDSTDVEGDELQSALASGLPFGHRVSYDADANLLSLTKRTSVNAAVKVAPFVTDGDLSDNHVAVSVEGVEISRAMSMDIRLSHDAASGPQPTRFETAEEGSADYREVEPAEMETVLADIAESDATAESGCSVRGDLDIVLESSVTVVRIRPSSGCVL